MTAGIRLHESLKHPKCVEVINKMIDERINSPVSNEKKIIDYIIVYEYCNNDLCIKVCDLIKNGWQPLGGISQSIRSSSDYPNFIMQAMVKYE